MVIRCHSNVLKIPNIYRNPYASSDEKEIETITAEENCTFLENEKEVYHRLGHHDGIINVIKISEEGIEMAYMENGSLFQYLQVQEPPHRLAVQWILKLARAIDYAHSMCIIIADVASKNVLLDKDMNVQLCDFSDSAAIPLDSDMSQAKHYGLSVKTDIFQFGSLMYEVLTRNAFIYDLLVDKDVDAQRPHSGNEDWQAYPVWPRPEDLPSTKHLLLGHVILRCWTGVYEHMGEVYEAIKTALQIETD